MGDVELRLVGMLQGKFLKLVSAFKAHDPRGRGLVRTSVFLQCVEEVLGQRVVEGARLVEGVGEFEPGWVAYPKFLAKFQEPLQEEVNPTLLASEDLEPRPLTHVGIPLAESIQKVIRANPQAIYEVCLCVCVWVGVGVGGCGCGCVCVCVCVWVCVYACVGVGVGGCVVWVCTIQLVPHSMCTVAGRH